MLGRATIAILGSIEIVAYCDGFAFVWLRTALGSPCFHQ